jgi:uncharacterized protein YciI
VKHFVLYYEFVADVITRRAPYREEHLRLIRDAHARGDLLMAGAVGDPPDGGLLIFRAASADIAEAFARADPYVKNDLVTRWMVKPWTVVAGA